MRARTKVHLVEVRGRGECEFCECVLCVLESTRPKPGQGDSSQPARPRPGHSGRWQPAVSQGPPQPARASPSQPPARQGRSHQARPSQAQEINVQVAR